MNREGHGDEELLDARGADLARALLDALEDAIEEARPKPRDPLRLADVHEARHRLECAGGEHYARVTDGGALLWIWRRAPAWAQAEDHLVEVVDLEFDGCSRAVALIEGVLNEGAAGRSAA